MNPLTAPYCNQCGRPLRSYENESNDSPSSNDAPLCGDCRTRRLQLDFLYPGFEYRSDMKPIISDWKYGPRSSWGQWLGQKLKNQVRGSITPDPWDALIPIPLHHERRTERGFNQSVQLCKQLSETLRIPTENIVRKHRRTQAQSSLSRSERINNLTDAFSIREEVNVDSRNFLLVDDIYTTGSTLQTVSEVLLANGADRVAAIVLFRTIPEQNPTSV